MPSDRTSVTTSVVIVDNGKSAVKVEGHTPHVVMLDTGAQPVILGIDFAKKIGLLKSNLRKSAWHIRTTSGTVEEVLGETSSLLTLAFNEGTAQQLLFQVNCLVTNATSYDVLLGQEALFPPGFTIDNWFEHAYYRVDWHTDGLQLGYIPLNLHGEHAPTAHLCVLKEVHAVSYVKHSLHEWMEESEEELAEAHAVESLLVTPTDVTPRLDVVERLRAAHGPLVAAMHQCEGLTSHGQPITPILSTPITWTPSPDGITLLELFGGISTGLEALLQSGMVVKKYIYVDTDACAREVSKARLLEFSSRFPQQFPPHAWKASFTLLPPDIQLIQRQHLELLGSLDLIIAGWECQGFSRAGDGAGLRDPRSALFMDLVQVLTWAQQLFPAVGYIIENTPSQFDQRERVQEDYLLVQHYLGPPLLLDAVHCGSYAHRLRNFWTNLAPISLLALALKNTIRNPALQVDQILDADSSCQPVTRQEPNPWYPANTPGQPVVLGLHSFHFLVHMPFKEMVQVWFTGIPLIHGKNLVQRSVKGLWDSKLVLLIVIKSLNCKGMPSLAV
ncbi:unnamed protein product [Calypogeia fissa]